MKFRDMRRNDRQVFDDLVEEILQNGEYGVLSVTGENGYPYGVPVNYAYKDNSVYFHCAGTGHKLDAIDKDGRVSFCIVTDTELLPEKFSTKYKSIVLFGRASRIEGDEKKAALMMLIEKYSAGFMEKGSRYVEKEAAGTVIVKIDIEHLTGKARL